MNEFFNERKKALGITEANLNDNEPSAEQMDKLSDEIDKELEDTTDGEPKEPKEDFITNEECAKRIRGKVKAQLESDYRVTLVAPTTEPSISEGFYNESLVVGKYQSPGGIFESSKPSIFEITVPWEEDEQLTELTSEVKLKLKIESGEYSIPLKTVNFSIKL